MEECNEVEESVLPEGVEDELHGKFGTLITFEQPPFGAFAFKRASQGVHDRLINKLADSKEKSQALREYTVACLCYPCDDAGKPDYKAAKALFQAIPGAVNELASEIQELGGSLNLKKR